MRKPNTKYQNQTWELLFTENSQVWNFLSIYLIDICIKCLNKDFRFNFKYFKIAKIRGKLWDKL